ncbi:MAG: hypothetical protein A2X94_15160 [Bdellovibrionales bacterium GWB1_55_8]|nr:MAG: hypothetical protein A2X94_15160 [Bdellovibrionales bacterium GWB1_55_8]
MNSSSIVLAAFTTFVAVSISGRPALAVEVAEPVGRMAFIRGEVTLDGKPVVEGSPVSVGDVIQTQLGKCTILLGQEHVVHLDAESNIKITQRLVENGRDETLLDLKYGRTRALVRSEPNKKRSFGIRARGAVMGVRGTHVYVDNPADPDLPQRFMTVEGLAHVTLREQAPVVLRGGESIETINRTDSGRAPAAAPVVRLPKKKVRELVREVAPPPKAITTGGDVRNFAGKPISVAPTPVRPLPVMPGSLLPLDPVADSVAEIIIKGEIIRK